MDAVSAGFTAETAQLTAEDLRVLQACVGFHAKAQSDPTIRDSLYKLWCKLEYARAGASPLGATGT